MRYFILPDGYARHNVDVIEMYRSGKFRRRTQSNRESNVEELRRKEIAYTLDRVTKCRADIPQRDVCRVTKSVV